MASNFETVLKDLLEKLVRVEEDLDGIRADRKEQVARLKSFGLPHQKLLAEAKVQRTKTEQDQEEDRAQARHAAALLGVACYLSDTVVEFEEELPQEQKEHAREGIKVIMGLDDQAAETREEAKELYNQVKAMGASVKAAKKTVTFMRSSEKFIAWKEETDAIEIYTGAVNLSS